MSKLASLLGLGVLAGVVGYDWWVWSNLLALGLDHIGSLIGFGLLALISLPVTVGGGVLGIYLLLGGPD
jgi:hypothetical protein